MALDLSNNPVRVVPSSVVSLERLETLDLSNTKLPEFPLSLTALPALRVLRYDQRAGSRLVALPDDFAQCVFTPHLHLVLLPTSEVWVHVRIGVGNS